MRVEEKFNKDLSTKEHIALVFARVICNNSIRAYISVIVQKHLKSERQIARKS